MKSQQDYYTSIQNNSGSSEYPAFSTINYSLGYSYFKLRNYSDARQAFARYIDSKPTDIKRLNDARLRQGDCFFMTKQYKDAIQLYDQAIAAKGSDADYALLSEICFCRRYR